MASFHRIESVFELLESLISPFHKLVPNFYPEKSQSPNPVNFSPPTELCSIFLNLMVGLASFQHLTKNFDNFFKSQSSLIAFVLARAVQISQTPENKKAFGDFCGKAGDALQNFCQTLEDDQLAEAFLAMILETRFVPLTVQL